jgi:hypothetical protein
MRHVSKLCLVAIAFLSVSCGSSSTNTSTSTSSFHCCVNKQWYTCPSSDAVSKCINDTSACSRDSSKDKDC